MLPSARAIVITVVFIFFLLAGFFSPAHNLILRPRPEISDSLRKLQILTISGTDRLTFLSLRRAAMRPGRLSEPRLQRSAPRPFKLPRSRFLYVRSAEG